MKGQLASRGAHLFDRRLVSIAWVSAVAVLTIGVLLGARTELAYRAQAARQVEVQADILAASVSAALVFEDAAAMRQYVEALRVNPAVAAAAVYDAAGRLVAQYHRPDAHPPPARVTATRTVWLARRLKVARPVVEQGASLGLVYLETEPEGWTTVVARHSGLGLLTLMAILLLGAVTAAAVQLQTRARLLGEANRRLTEEMAARGEAEAALRQSQKMEALGQLTGGIAHDFNNLLQVVQGAFELILRKPGDRPRVAAWAQNGLEAAGRGASLTRQLLAFSRSQKLELKPFVVADLIAGMRELLEHSIGGSVELVFDLDTDAAPVLSDRTQLELAVLNLAINARDAMADGGRLTITTRLVTLPAGEPDLEPGDYVALSVADSGEGMSPEVAARAFDPFFTTKGVGKGTGLGLSQVYGVARQAGGTARIESVAGAGTAVTLFLRRSGASLPAGARDSRGPATILAPAAGGSVLVVDDEAQVRQLACDALELLGYRVLSADSGPGALEILERERPDVMVLDYAMPGMNGAELARLARQRWPGAPIIFASGHADTAEVEAALGAEASILRKPFDMDALARAVAELAARTEEPDSPLPA